MAKKTVQFQQLLPVINEYIAKGYTATEIVVFLKDNYNLNLSVRVFYTYSNLFKNKAKFLKSEPTQNEPKLNNPVSVKEKAIIELTSTENVELDENAKQRNLLNATFNKKQQINDEVKKLFEQPSSTFDPTKYLKKT
jgi:hypothetical protein